MKKDTVGFHIPKLPADLHADIKVAAAKSRKSMIEWVTDAMKNQLRKEMRKQ